MHCCSRTKFEILKIFQWRKWSFCICNKILNYTNDLKMLPSLQLLSNHFQRFYEIYVFHSVSKVNNMIIWWFFLVLLSIVNTNRYKRTNLLWLSTYLIYCDNCAIRAMENSAAKRPQSADFQSQNHLLHAPVRKRHVDACPPSSDEVTTMMSYIIWLNLERASVARKYN